MNKEQISTIRAYNNSARHFAEKIATLSNYNECYDYLLQKLNPGDSILDLACGPGNISKYLSSRQQLNITGFDLSDAMLDIARENVPDGLFENRSIIEFDWPDKFDLIINGFGIPFLTKQQRLSCFKSTRNLLKSTGLIYLSFMEGEKEGFETTSYNPDELFYFYYHKRQDVIFDLETIGFKRLKQWELDYLEADGSVTKDVVIVAEV
jgi:cyclopropane fatty-acyl-phospholipid synthase-like methyltransferase